MLSQLAVASEYVSVKSKKSQRTLSRIRFYSSTKVPNRLLGLKQAIESDARWVDIREPLVNHILEVIRLMLGKDGQSEKVKEKGP